MQASRLDRFILAGGAAAGALAVIGGAFGSHALREVLEARPFEVFQVAMRYLMYHGLALLAVGVILHLPNLELPRRLLRVSGVLYMVGILIFCGSLTIYSLSGIRWVAMITPVGGSLWIVAWVLLLVSALRLRASEN